MIARRDGGEILLEGEAYRSRFPIGDLGAWIDFYREMSGRMRGRYAHHYAPTLEALEAVEAEISADG
ncbi:hypothetical protein [Salipiger bermudensis]|uniref:Uncharacterized protein n=1 Tax=Salipiger bermudensis (strain DSM 26914 / JCM 13377 / KCTC 12554 / HTCC2601) TaxID=314265 RepID=Q0FLK2_SALBH|nr:hypothetical protein [Salipiger bermudensis]EAU45096.1 hypothetical protein R2601_22956 [Salipiger bermudensis HTCC2601]